ncbi:hypothetical protein V8F06_011324 [Rhypophila decipiens]
MFPRLISLLACAIPTMVTFSTRVSALGCYSHGPTFGDLAGGDRDVNAAIDDFCQKQTGSGFFPSDTRAGCYPYANNKRLDMSIQNQAGSYQTISKDECIRHYQREKGACDHGSEQLYSPFWVYIDPNDGGCPGF